MLNLFLHNSRSRGAILMVLVGCTMGCQTEVAKWEFAQALLQVESGQRDAAIPLMKRAVEKSGHQLGLTLMMADEMSQLGDPESVAICDRLLVENANQMSNQIRNDVKLLKSKCQQHLGDFTGALDTYKELLRDHVSRNDQELNNLAYYRALAKRELPLAAENIELAIEKIQFASNWPSGNSLTLAAKTAVADSLIARYLDQTGITKSAGQATIAALSGQIEKYDASFYRLEKMHDQTRAMQSDLQFDLQLKAKNVTQLVDANQELNRSNLATLLTVRALLYQDRGDLAACNQDRYRVQELGRDADQIVTRLPSPQACLDLQNYGIMYLDTQGFVQSRLSWHAPNGSGYQEATGNLTLAIDSIQLQRIAFNSPLLNTAQLPVDTVRAMQNELKKGSAVLLYHRMLTHQRDGNNAAATADRQLILDLGFEPNERLF